MRDRFSIVISLTTVFVLYMLFAQLPHVRSQSDYEAWFTHIYVTNGNDEIDLINGGTAKVYSGQRAFKKLVYYNNGIGGLDGARLYTKIYQNDQLAGSSTIEIDAYLESNNSRTDQFSSSLTSSGTYFYRVELWWRYWQWFTEYNDLVDTREFELKVVELNVSDWGPSFVSVTRGFGTGTLNVALSNGGNDKMYDAKITVMISSGLTITPEEQNLGIINEGEKKSTSFSVQANRDFTPNDYTLKFEVAYNDFSGVTHKETFFADATVTSNFLIDNLYPIIIVSAISAVCIVLIIYLVRSRRRKTETSVPK